MSEGWKCDRCGEFTTKTGNVISSVELNWEKWKSGRKVESSKQYDLCSDCAEELNEWIKGYDG